MAALTHVDARSCSDIRLLCQGHGVDKRLRLGIARPPIVDPSAIRRRIIRRHIVAIRHPALGRRRCCHLRIGRSSRRPGVSQRHEAGEKTGHGRGHSDTVGKRGHDASRPRHNGLDSRRQNVQPRASIQPLEADRSFVLKSFFTEQGSHKVAQIQSTGNKLRRGDPARSAVNRCPIKGESGTQGRKGWTSTCTASPASCPR